MLPYLPQPMSCTLPILFPAWAPQSVAGLLQLSPARFSVLALKRPDPSPSLLAFSIWSAEQRGLFPMWSSHVPALRLRSTVAANLSERRIKTPASAGFGWRSNSHINGKAPAGKLFWILDFGSLVTE